MALHAGGVGARQSDRRPPVGDDRARLQLSLFLDGAAIHEVGHCYRRLNGQYTSRKPLPIVAWIAPVRAWFTRRVLVEEVFADMTEVGLAGALPPATLRRHAGRNPEGPHRLPRTEARHLALAGNCPCGRSA
jgi:hypothetical protein